jgi:hypothetical protein
MAVRENIAVGNLRLCWLALALLACDSTIVTPNAEEQCRLGGGRWDTVNCAGQGDVCDRAVCEAASGDGCVCDVGCWDGERCRDEAPPPPPRCYNTCDEAPAFDCVATCVPDSPSRSPVCIGGAWACPPEEGYFSESLCDGEPAVGECGGHADVPCPEGLHCDYGPDSDGTCGRSGKMGVCAEGGTCGEFDRDEACSCAGWTNTKPHCGPDDPFVDSGTYAVCEEVDSTVPRCGLWLYCQESRYCVRTPGPLPGVFDYQCENLGFDSETDPHVASCEALADHPCGGDCAEVGDAVILTCGCDS